MTFMLSDPDDIEADVADFRDLINSERFAVVTTLRGTANICEITTHGNLACALLDAWGADDGPMAAEVHPITTNV